MTTTIKYTNSDGVLVSLEQAERLKFYNKETYNNGLLKKIEKFGLKNRDSDETLLRSIEYYLDTDEVFEDIVNQYITTVKYLYVYYDMITNTNGDVYYEYVLYTYGNIDFKRRKVVNNEGLLLAICLVDLNTNEIKKQAKYFYGDLSIYKRVNYEDPFLVISYENDEVSTLYIYDNDYTLSEFLSSDISNVFIWNDYPYYHNFLPMLPEDITV
ncbi:hypothetical protein V1389_10565 [Flavobacterium rakeshii]|uniref:hypothetical protein n=1 Tax=Flavobacterium rakeshii TaxID=1038845 RepID=UPI002E7C530F|nr:hypothetical protein [Flavobacterium rakeshii]MEE1898781.1 hypothetical protein [Flavobacterium rakeshii]